MDITPPQTPKEPVPAKIRKPSHRKSFLTFSGLALFLGLIQFALQYFRYDPGEFGDALFKSFGFSGATLITLALFSSLVFKWFPRTAQYWRWRRYLGVWGWFFLFLHAIFALQVEYSLNLQEVFYSWNPIKNPVVFGLIGFTIFTLMAATSTDEIMAFIGPKRWKVLHRFVYVAHWAAIFHFILESPEMWRTIPGLGLLLLTGATLLGQLYWWGAISEKRHYKSMGVLVGLLIILLYIVTAYFAYRKIQFESLSFPTPLD